MSGYNLFMLLLVLAVSLVATFLFLKEAIKGEQKK